MARSLIAIFVALTATVACGGSPTAPSEQGLPIGAAHPVDVSLKVTSPDGEVEIFIDRMYPAPGGCGKTGEDLIVIGRAVRSGGDNEPLASGEIAPQGEHSPVYARHASGRGHDPHQIRKAGPQYGNGVGDPLCRRKACPGRQYPV